VNEELRHYVREPEKPSSEGFWKARNLTFVSPSFMGALLMEPAHHRVEVESYKVYLKKSSL
jgi:hypothetical protein